MNPNSTAPSRDVAERLGVFVESGHLSELPTHWQLWLGAFEMAPFVLSPDVTAEEHYRRSLWAHPSVRQPFLLAHIGPDHLSAGSGLRVRLQSVCKHLQLTWHEGMPTYDLQLAQTHPGGLEALRSSTLALLADETPAARRQNRLARRLFDDPAAYYRQFTDPGGWIDRAAAFDYEPPPEDSLMPPEFTSLVGFAAHCARSYPRTPAETGWAQIPGTLLHLLGRRAREGRVLDWGTRRLSP